MKKFNKLVEADCTNVLIGGNWYLVKRVHRSRQWIEVYGLVGWFQRGHISKFTNKAVHM